MMSKPFYYGKEVVGEYFVNRDKEIKEMVSLLKGKPSFNIAIVGSRRIGKTSLIFKLKEFLIQNFGVIIKCEEELFPKTPENFFKNLVIRFSSEYDKIIKSPTIKLKRLKKLLPKRIGLEYKDITFFLEWKEKDVKPLMDKTFELIKRIDLETGLKVVVFLDEFQELYDFGSEFLWALRGYIADSPASFVVTSSQTRFEKMLANEEHPFFNFFTVKKIGPIPQQELRKFISTRAKIYGIKFSNDVLDKLLTYTNGHPYYTQLLAAECYELAKLERKKEVKKRLYEEAMEKALEHIPAHLTSQFFRLKGRTRDAFIALCLGKLTVSEVAKEIRISTSNASQILKQIESTFDLIEKVDIGKYQVKDKFLAAWVQKRFMR